MARYAYVVLLDNSCYSESINTVYCNCEYISGLGFAALEDGKMNGTEPENCLPNYACI